MDNRINERSAWISLVLNFAVTLYHKLDVRGALKGATEFAIISGFEGATRTDRTLHLYNYILTLGYAALPGDGSYKGVVESAVLVFPKNGTRFTHDEFEELNRIGADYHQESIFYSRHGISALYYIKSQTTELIGNDFVEGEEAKKQDGFSTFAGITFSAVTVNSVIEF